MPWYDPIKAKIAVVKNKVVVAKNFVASHTSLGVAVSLGNMIGMAVVARYVEDIVKSMHESYPQSSDLKLYSNNVRNFWEMPLHADVVLGPIPLYGVDKMTFVDSQNVVKFRAKDDEFYGHQKGQKFAMTISGVFSGPVVPFFVTTLRWLQRACEPREAEARAATPDELAMVQLTDTNASGWNWSASPNVLEGSVVIKENDPSGVFIKRLDKPMYHWSFPVTMKDQTFTNLYVETCAFAKEAKAGQNSIRYTLMLRHEVIPPRYLTVDKTIQAAGGPVIISIGFMIKGHTPIEDNIAGGIFYAMSMAPKWFRAGTECASLTSLNSAESLVLPSSQDVIFDVSLASSSAPEKRTVRMHTAGGTAYYNAMYCYQYSQSIPLAENTTDINLQIMHDSESIKRLSIYLSPNNWNAVEIGGQGVNFGMIGYGYSDMVLVRTDTSLIAAVGNPMSGISRNMMLGVSRSFNNLKLIWYEMVPKTW